jgi:hypothetical protein
MLALAGGLTGAAPLIAVNVASLARDGGLISLESFAAPGPWTKPSFPTFVLDYVNLARGAEVQSLILGQSISQSTFGKALPGLLLLCLAAVNVGLRKRSSAFARSNLLLGCYFAVGCALYLLPNFTWAHHWIVGTPFQYLAIALSAEALWRMATPTTWAARVIRPAFFLTLLCWMLAQGAGLWTIEAALLRGDASQLWHPSFGELGRFAGERRGRAFFIVASWGLGSQIASLGQGEQGLVDELFWDYRGPEDVANLAEAHRGRDLYVVARSFAIPSLSPEIEEPRERILADMATLGGWVEEPVEPEMARLSGITVRKFAPRRS